MLRTQEKVAIIERVDNITLILDRLNEIIEQKQSLLEDEELLKQKVKQFLKERNWKRYVDERNKISVTIDTKKEERIDIKKIKLMLHENDLNQITQIREVELLVITTPRMTERLRKTMSMDKQ